MIAISLCGFFLVSSCNMKKNADLIVLNGNIYTVDESFSKAEAFAVKDGLFTFVGTNDEVLSKYKSDNVLDLQGAAVYPGLNDAHGHLLHLGNTLIRADLRGARSFDEIIQRLLAYAKDKNAAYIVGDGWDQNLWSDPTIPDNTELNRLFPNTPVILNRIDYHAAIANDAAIKMAGLNPSDKNIPKGEALIKRGKFTGLFMERTADYIGASLPEPSPEEIKAMILAAQNECFKYGLTSVNNAGTEFADIVILDTMQSRGELKIRVDAFITPSPENFERFKDGPYRNGRFNVATLKLFVDGALGSRGALLLKPYSDDLSTIGLHVGTPEEFIENVKWAYEHNMAVATHCIGDAANREALDVYGLFLKEKNDKRWRIEHAQIIDPADMDKFSKYSIVPSIQPTHCTSDMLWADERLGDRIKYAYAYKQLLNQLGWLPSGTDFPVENVNPFYTFMAGVYRQNLDLIPEGGFQMENSLTKEETLRSMTIWAAKATFEESVKGSVEVGKYADFIVTDRDFMTASVKEVSGTKVLKTYVGGEQVY